MRLPLVAGLLVACLVAPAAALDETKDQETIAELLATPPPPTDGRKNTVAERRWSILPQIGYGPETGGVGGVKYEHRNFLDLGIDFDVSGTYAMNQQQSLSVDVGYPHLLDDRVLLLLRVGYDYDPQVEFFSLGNNNVGPDAASTHSFQDAKGAFTIGWRPWPRLAVNGSVGIRYVEVGHGDRDGSTPFTQQRFPDLVGNDGGFVVPLTLSLVWSTRDNVVRPTRGWRAIAVLTHADRVLLSDWEFTRVVGDVSYLFPLFGGRQVLGARLNGGYVFGPRRAVPFWELEEAGGDDTLRGFFPERFLGTARLLATLEYRAKLFEFDFFHIWRVQVDGALFGEAGRVYVDREALVRDFGLTEKQARVTDDDVRFSYGAGLRFALSRALIARVDVGFSEEETALVYLEFGHTF